MGSMPWPRVTNCVNFKGPKPETRGVRAPNRGEAASQTGDRFRLARASNSSAEIPRPAAMSSRSRNRVVEPLRELLKRSATSGHDIRAQALQDLAGVPDLAVAPFPCVLRCLREG